MSGKDFEAWMEKRGLSITGAMAALEIGSRHTIIKFKRDGAPLYIALACAAIAAGVAPWTAGN
jgi:hypothetical protein